MKNLLFTLLFSLLTFSLFAQEIPSPEFDDIPYLWNKTSNELIMPTKVVSDMKLAGLKIVYKFKGITSETATPVVDKTSLLMSTSNTTLIPTMKIYELDVKKKHRQAEIMSAGYGGGSKTNTEGVIEFNSKKVGDNLYEVVLSKSLPAGEYAIVLGTYSYTFSVK